MERYDRAFFHKLYGEKKPRAVYYKKDFIDYLCMIVLSALVIGVSYGFGSVVAIIGFALCAFMLAMFVVRHGIEFRVPLILKSPQEVFYMLVYKIQNLKAVYFMAIGLLLLENFLIAATPNLPHHVELMRRIAFYLFYIHLIGITAFRTAILVDHLAKKELVREVLMQTPWQRVVKENTNITMEIVHAYCTGVLTHIILIGSWYLIITYFKFSVIFVPIVCVLDLFVHMKWLRVTNAWFYRDHWLGHNSEFEFVFLHGTHHDAIPSGLIAVAENGFLEGVMRSTMGFPVPFYNPLISFAVYMLDIKTDIETHQYIPGIYPRLPIKTMEITQHATHHYGPIEPYSLAIKMDLPGVPEDYKKARKLIPDEIMNSIKIDEDLTGFKWDNPTHRRILELYAKYHN